MPDTVPLSAHPVIPCMFCGQPEHVEIFEVWGHEWMFETCCEGLIWTTWRYTYGSC